MTPRSSFVPSLAIIPEEEPRLQHYRAIQIVAPGSQTFTVTIPIFNVNVYAPEPPMIKTSSSFQRLLDEMEEHIRGSERSEQYRQMADALRRKVALEQAEQWRTSSEHFSDRDWYWYSVRTGNYTDEPVFKKSIDIGRMEQYPAVVKQKEEEKEEEEDVDNGDRFDLDADF